MRKRVHKLFSWLLEPLATEMMGRSSEVNSDLQHGAARGGALEEGDGRRHAKSHDPATIGRWYIFRMQKDKGWNIVKFVESISLNFMNDIFFAEIL